MPFRNSLRPSDLGHMPPGGYRPDIDGLRAIAVLSVVGYHAFPYWIRGGFIGVDIFFVISGFLISGLILGGLQRGQFSLADFYSRRIRRIFPALLVVLVVCFAAGWFSLLANEYEQLGKHMAGGAGFVANLVLWRESGYFDVQAETKPLLHLWSLGIEEQFYIVWPVLLWLAVKWRFHVLATTLGLALASFALGIVTIGTDQVASFYSPMMRFWELLIGAALAWFAVHRRSMTSGPIRAAAVASVAGLTLIAIGLMVITREGLFPGWWALLPTVGTALVIAAGSQAWPNRTLLSHPVLVWFGLISFPLYLWHWPLLSFARIIESDTPTRPVRVAAVALSVVLAWLTYRVIERPIRFGACGHRKAIALAFAMLVVGLVGLETQRRDGFDGYGFRQQGTQEFADYFENDLPRWDYYKRIGAFEKSRAECNFYDIEKFRTGRATRVPRDRIDPSCYLRDPGATHVAFLWGDSHAQQLNYGLKNHLPQGWQLLQVASSDCPAQVDARTDSDSDHCLRSNWFAMKAIRNAKPNVVIVAQNTGHDAEQMRATAQGLKAVGVERIVFVGPTPHWTSNLPNIVIRRLWKDTPERTLVGIDERVLSSNTELQQAFTPSDGVVLIDLIAFFCDRTGCLTRIGVDKMTGITSWDYGHLTPIASDHLADRLLAGVVAGREPMP